MDVLRSLVGAWPMLLVVGMGAFAGAVIVERWWCFVRTGCDAGAFAGALRQQVRQGNGAQAIDLCTKNRSPVARVAEQLLRGGSLSREDLERGVSIAVRREVMGMERGLSLIAAMRWLAPALTLFATAVDTGRALPFAATRSGWNALILASSVGDALIVLGGGALVASLAIVFHHIFEWKIRTRRIQMESMSQSLFEAVTKHGFPNTLSTGPAVAGKASSLPTEPPAAARSVA